MGLGRYMDTDVSGESDTVKGQSARIDAWQWSRSERFHGQVHPTSREDLTVPPRRRITRTRYRKG